MLGYQIRNKPSHQFSYDLFTSVGAFSDFESSARKGIRFPSHAVGMFHVNHTTDFIFGVDYLDRDDVEVLPVIGVSLRDVYVRGLRMDPAFEVISCLIVITAIATAQTCHANARDLPACSDCFDFVLFAAGNVESVFPFHCHRLRESQPPLTWADAEF